MTIYQPSASIKRILIVEDDKALNDLVAGLLCEAGYLVRQCFDGAAGLKAAKAESFHLVLLDVMLPKMDGFSVLDRLRRLSDMPVIMLTARGAEEDRITGFKTGADDYLPKPFNFDELILRIEAIIRRSCRAVLREQSQPRGLLAFDGLEIDNKKAVARYGSEDLRLTNMEFRILSQLVQQSGQLLSKPYMYQEVLGRPYSRNERSLDVHISKLRRKLRAAGFNADRVQTMHGQGYVLK